MSWFSILPPQLSIYEVWIVRFFLFLGFASIAPWILLIFYDIILYCFRTATYELPLVGGRARGRQRPRAPSLAERPKDLARRLSLSASPSPQRPSISSSTSATRPGSATGSASRRSEVTFRDE